MISVVTLVRGKSASYSRLDWAGSPEYLGARQTSCCFSATLVVPSALISNVPLTATSHTSAPSRSRTQERSAANGVRLSKAHIGSVKAQLIDTAAPLIRFNPFALVNIYSPFM